MAMEKIEKKTLEDLLIKAIEKHLCALLKSAFMHVCMWNCACVPMQFPSSVNIHVKASNPSPQ